MNSERLYRINTVSQMTGVPASTLRTWQRRYGVPRPRRTESSYRLFADRDVAQVIQLRDLVRQGLSASEAARQVLDAMDPVDAPPGDPFVLLQHDILAALHRFDLVRLEFLLQQAVAMATGEALFSRLFMPLLGEVGHRWQVGELSVAQEHLVSELLDGISRQMLRAVQPAPASPAALLACFAEEQHLLPLYAVAFQLARRGFRTLMLGARTPPEALGRAVEALAPDLVALSLTIDPGQPRGDRLVRGYAEAVGQTPWAVGGAAAPLVAEAVISAGGVVAAPQEDAVAQTLSKLGM